MDEQQALAYVLAAAAAVSLPLDRARAGRVAAHLVRTAVLAEQLDAFELEMSDETAEVFCPAPFPTAENPAMRA